jgi:hypothetical protein
MTPKDLATELIERWYEPIQTRSWPGRLELLTDIHEQLQVDIGDFDIYSEVSPQFIAGLIARLGTDEIGCIEQAHVYSNSGNDRHREMAGLWLGGYHTAMREGRRVASPRPVATKEQRATQRHVVNLPTHLKLGAERVACRLLDISAGGARVSSAAQLAIGAQVALEIPRHGQEIASVVRAAQPQFGLAFPTKLPKAVTAVTIH